MADTAQTFFAPHIKSGWPLGFDFFEKSLIVVVIVKAFNEQTALYVRQPALLNDHRGQRRQRLLFNGECFFTQVQGDGAGVQIVGCDIGEQANGEEWGCEAKVFQLASARSLIGDRKSTGRGEGARAGAGNLFKKKSFHQNVRSRPSRQKHGKPARRLRAVICSHGPLLQDLTAQGPCCFSLKPCSGKISSQNSRPVGRG